MVISSSNTKTTAQRNSPANSNKGKGCKHYQRSCEIFAPCCSEYFGCRLCHDEIHAEFSSSPLGPHRVDRHAIQTIKCNICGKEQSSAAACTYCKAVMGKYYCGVCNLFDHQGEEKKIFHCDKCGICRVGGRENYFHCEKCNACYSNDLKRKHKCVENSMRQDCAICLEPMFDARVAVGVLPCGHTFHQPCLREASKRRMGCPICKASMTDMSEVNDTLRRLIQEQPSTENGTASHQLVSILCNDCLSTSNVPFHPIGLECNDCGSFNTSMS